MRKLEPFRLFLPVAAQCSGKIINHSAIAREINAQVPTVQNYFQILEETHLGFYLPHFHQSVRKSQLKSSKFYLFDLGVKNQLEGALSEGIPTEGTSRFGELFEAFIVTEIFRMNHYFEKDFRLSYFQTKNGADIDLILSKGKKTIIIEIKSTNRVDLIEVQNLARLATSFPNAAKVFYFSYDKIEKTHHDVHCLPWQKFFELFSTPKFYKYFYADLKLMNNSCCDHHQDFSPRLFF